MIGIIDKEFEDKFFSHEVLLLIAFVSKSHASNIKDKNSEKLDFYIDLKSTDGGQLEISEVVAGSYLRAAEQLQNLGVGGGLNVYNMIFIIKL